MRIALGIEYDGTGFSGWERQLCRRTVQQVVELAVGAIADHAIKVVCAGRTDAGVHALGQVVHFDTRARRDQRNWLLGVNSRLPDDVNVRWCSPVNDSFHARFSAQSRMYRYLLHNQPTRSALQRSRTVWEHQPLDAALMQAGAGYLLGKHDFSSFRGSRCQAHSPIRTIHELSVRRVGRFIVIDIRANAFLLHMVRNIAGVLVAIGKGERQPRWAEQVLLAKDRRQAGVTARPQGLYLIGVNYPSRFALGVHTHSLTSNAYFDDMV